MPDKTKAQTLRRNQTEAEKQLWRQLRNRNLENYKFRRQHTIKPYIVDFLCFSHKLIVELDGGHHNEENQIIYDKKRSHYLEEKGFVILRFWNNQVMGEMESVLNEILLALEPLPPHPSPLPQGEGAKNT